MNFTSSSSRCGLLKSIGKRGIFARFLNDAVTILPKDISFLAADGYELHGKFWGQNVKDSVGSVLINGATGLKCSYYANYAQYLSSLGLNVLIYDYRGLGKSRPADLRGFKATKRDWGIYDTEGAIVKLLELVPKNQLLVAVCSSIGGFCLGLAPSGNIFHRALFMGCQYAYYGDYIAKKRLEFTLKWQVVMPVVAQICGYFPGRYLGFCEDLPKGIALEWGLRYHPSFYHNYHLLPHDNNAISVPEMKERMAGFKAEVLSVAHYEDEFATPEAVYRLMSYFPNCDSRFVRIDKRQKGGEVSIEHVAFFNKRFADTMWPLSAEWVLKGTNPWIETSRNIPKNYEKKLIE